MPAVLTSPTPGSTFGGSGVTFSWTAGIGVTEYSLDLGTNPLSYPGNIYVSPAITTTSVAVTGLPVNGETVYATLKSLINGVWDSRTYTYTAQ